MHNVSTSELCLLSPPQIVHKLIIVVVLLVRSEAFAGILLPDGCWKGREEGVRFRAGVYQSEAKFRGQRHHHFIDLATAHDEDLLLFQGWVLFQFREVSDDFAAWGVFRLHGAGEDDVAAVGERTSDG